MSKHASHIIDLFEARPGLRRSRLGGLPGLHTDSDLRQLDDGKWDKKVHESTYPWTADAGFETLRKYFVASPKTLDHHCDRPRLVGLALSSYPGAVHLFAGSFGYEKSTKDFALKTRRMNRSRRIVCLRERDLDGLGDRLCYGVLHPVNLQG